MSSRRSTTGPRLGIAAIALLVDAILVVVFAGIGRGSHARAATIAGLFETAWPFLAGLAIVWLVAFVWRSPLAILRAGVPVWIGAVALGMLFRMLSGQGTALPFVIVATLTLALMLIGWRAIVAIVSKLRKRQQSA
ncbi:DUF3054 domain-containing protein [Leucobacter denitrificans]|uniref:DUF3054 domain-containing protein n=1 Tax=Leucobacter denitrificans TaxID=683042 RepID=A0A7G9S4M8_9MICO|nr:DUF3054 domain-containing protein [Leucobacter denitrificans]QNN62803.1 DUF3054 domain-containing protein [Leucobacter denitrificans]